MNRAIICVIKIKPSTFLKIKIVTFVKACV